MTYEVAKVSDDVYAVDLHVFGEKGYLSVYFVAGDEPLLFDVGPSSSTDDLIEALGEIGYRANEIRYAFLSQVYPDHAGGIAPLIERAVDARVIVHPSGVRHLSDPAKTHQSFSGLFGEASKKLGGFPPVDPSKITQAPAEFSLGKKVAKVIYCPGHAYHQICLQVGETLFAADALSTNAKMGEYYFPVSLPPAFDYQKYTQDLDNLLSLRLETLCLSHFGFTKNPTDAITKSLESVKWARIQVDNLSRDGLSVDEISQTLVEKYAKNAELSMDFLRVYVKAGVLAMLQNIQRLQTRK